MKPCPRCASPFVRASHAGDEPLSTRFSCFVCGLDFTVPQALEMAVQVWDAWKRADAYASAEVMTEMSLLNLQRGATRLERLVCAIVSHQDRAGSGQSTATFAQWVVRLARDLEKGIEGGLVDLEELAAKIESITSSGRNTLREVLQRLEAGDGFRARATPEERLREVLQGLDEQCRAFDLSDKERAIVNRVFGTPPGDPFAGVAR